MDPENVAKLLGQKSAIFMEIGEWTVYSSDVKRRYKVSFWICHQTPRKPFSSGTHLPHEKFLGKDITQLSQSSSFSWAELAIISQFPTTQPGILSTSHLLVKVSR